MNNLLIKDYVLTRLSKSHDAQEAQNLALMVSEFIMDEKTDDWESLADNCVNRLSTGEPVQYLTGYSWFYDLKMNVNSNVLIPRPETEELVDWVVQEYSNGLISSDPEILDIGTGSGCIALVLANQIRKGHVTGIDISNQALEVAMANAAEFHLAVEFRQKDVMKDPLENEYDVIVSNPPYVSQEEFEALAPGVRDFEPRIALKPETEDPLIFYRKIAELGKIHLKPNGRIYLELNEFRAEEIKAIFVESDYTTEMRKDMQGKWRMLKAWLT